MEVIESAQMQSTKFQVSRAPHCGGSHHLLEARAPHPVWGDRRDQETANSSHQITPLQEDIAEAVTLGTVNLTTHVKPHKNGERLLVREESQTTLRLLTDVLRLDLFHKSAALAQAVAFCLKKSLYCIVLEYNLPSAVTSESQQTRALDPVEILR